ncbi:TonB family C-terminal domain-containing protein [Verrucomicrobium sp. GAS474]|uniref:energy transducer TonB n=1 Tax=Verrucomicrobium sp. GAS474 TaxID=1882831 RepID=UPI00087C6F15|nr:energy transducer TonB [Verrucomicrobium sp. GAS474]SDT85806.1 TonB family C-terminal domain-containing protein [Verrucomicrobium sp. GAS474]
MSTLILDAPAAGSAFRAPAAPVPPVPRPALLVGVLPQSGLKKPLLIAVSLHVVLIGLGFLSRHDTLLDLINKGEVESVAASDPVSQPPIEIVDLVPPPPSVDNPEFVVPKEVRIELPKPEEKPQPKPTPVAAAPAYAFQKPVVGDPNFPKPPYPYAAKAKHQQGTVTLALSVAEGQVVDVQVSESSGYVVLDSSAVAWIRQKWRFPATMTRNFTQPISFQLANG